VPEPQLLPCPAFASLDVAPLTNRNLDMMLTGGAVTRDRLQSQCVAQLQAAAAPQDLDTRSASSDLLCSVAEDAKTAVITAAPVQNTPELATTASIAASLDLQMHGLAAKTTRVETCVSVPAAPTDLYRTMDDQYCVSGYVRARIEGVLKCHQAAALATDSTNKNLVDECGDRAAATGSLGQKVDRLTDQCAGEGDAAVGDTCAYSSSPCEASPVTYLECREVDDATAVATLQLAAGAFDSLLSWADKP